MKRNQLIVGREYEIIVKNSDEWFRYQMKDVFRMMGWIVLNPAMEFIEDRMYLESVL